MLRPVQDSPLFRPVPVDRKVALRAWPLVQNSHPESGQEAWMAYAASLRRKARRKAGLIAIEDSRGYIHGVFAWHVHRAIGAPRVMRVTDLVVANLPGRSLAECIVESIREVARETDSDTVLVEIGERQIAPDALLSDGFEHLVLHCMRTLRGDAPV